MNTVSEILPDVPVLQSVASEQGLSLLESRDDIRDIVSAVCDKPDNPESCFSEYPFLAQGNNAMVWNVGNVAVKLVTPTSGRDSWNKGQSTKPDDLVGQFAFMSRLGRHLKNDSAKSISVPDQYLALRTTDGNGLLAMEYLEQQSTLVELMLKRKYGKEEQNEIYRGVQTRLRKAIGSSALKLGVHDLGIGATSRLQGNNVMVPRDTEYPEKAPLCIIDQPKRGMAGRVAADLARVVWKFS